MSSPTVFIIDPESETYNDLKDSKVLTCSSISSPINNDSNNAFSFTDSPQAKYILRKKSRRIQNFANKVDLPQGSDHHGPALIDGVNVPEVNEEINDAYDDLIREIGELQEYLNHL